MFFCIFIFLTSCGERTQKCTAKNYMMTATNSNYNSFFGKSKPLFIRLYKKSCIYTPASQAYWEEASKLLPNMQFVSAECDFQAPNFCSHVKDIQGVNSYPEFRIYLPNQTTYATRFNDNNNIHHSTIPFTNAATDSASIIPFDNPLIESLLPKSTNKFFTLYKYPVFLLYNSNCEEDISFINQFYNKISAKEISLGDYGFGKIDCNLYPEECDKWGGQVPSANIFSRFKGISIRISDADDFIAKFDTIISQLDASKVACPTPDPVLTAESTPEPEFEGYTIIKNEKLENRDLDDLQRRYYEAITPTYQRSCPTVECGDGLNAGNAQSCKDYNLQPEAITDVLRLLNYYRELAGVPNDVTNNATLNQVCYYTAQYLSRKGELSHILDNNYRTKCGQWPAVWEEMRATLAQSNIAQSDVQFPPLKMIDGFMDDMGINNEKELGHRRWFLYPYLKTIGVGFYPLSKKPTYIGGKPYFSETDESGVFRVSHNRAITTDHPDVPFIAWPAPGPFPAARVPESFSLTFSGFSSLTVDDIKVKMTRDDGENLIFDAITLNIDQSIACLSSCLIVKLSAASALLCTAPHKLHVQVVIEKTKQVIEYNIEFFDNTIQDIACFYSTDKSKCPEDIADDKKFGPGEYNNFNPNKTVAKATINVVEEITLTSDLELSFPRFFIQGSAIDGKIIVGTRTSLEITNPSKTDISVLCNPTGNLVCGSLATTIQPKSLKLTLTALPNFKGRSNKVLVFSGAYIDFDYQKEVITTDTIYYFSIYFSGTSGCLMAIPHQTSMNLCYKDVVSNLECTLINDLQEMKNYVSSGNRIVKLYDLNYDINISGQVFPSDAFSNQKYIFYTNKNIKVEYAPSINSRVREIFIQPMSSKNNLASTFTIAGSELYPEQYFNQEIFPKRYLISNLFLSRFTANNNQYQLPNIIGDQSSKDVAQATEEKVFNESINDFTDHGSYKYTEEYNYPLFVTNALYESYTFTTTNKDARIRVQPTEGSKFTTAVLNFPSSDSDFASIFVQDYGYVTIKASANLFPKIRLVNVNQAKFVAIEGEEVSGISTDVIGNKTVDWSSANSQVSFDTLNFRTDTIVSMKNCKSENAYVYDANPVIKGLKINNLQVIRSYPTLMDCQVTGTVVVNFTGNSHPAIQVIGESTVFNPTSIVVSISNALSEATLLLIGNTQAISRITLVGEQASNYKAVVSSDNKGIFIVAKDGETPAKSLSLDEFLIKEYRESNEVALELNPPPPGKEYTDSILYPLYKPSNSPIPERTPSKVTENPPTKVPAPETVIPASTPTPEATLIVVEELHPPEIEKNTVPIDSITETNDGNKDYVLINTSKIEGAKDSVRYETKLDSSTSSIVVDNTKNIDYQLTITDKDHEIKVSTSEASSNVLIHGNEGCNLKLENSESMEFSGQGTFKLNSAKEDEESLTISKLLPTGPITLETNKGLTVKDAQIFGQVTINADSSKNAEYSIKNIKLEQGCTLESSNVKLFNIEIGIGASIGYRNSDFSESTFKIYYNKLSAVKQYPLNINSLDELKNTPKSISVLSKELGTTLSNDKVIIVHKEFDQQSVSKEEVEKICNNWAQKFVAANDEFNDLSYDAKFNKDGGVTSFTLFAYKHENKNDGGKKKSPSTGLIAGVAVAAVVVVVAVIIGVLIYLRRKKSYEKSTDGGDLPADDNKEENDNKEEDAEVAPPEVVKDEL
ncbi:hypothetical protein M9Y10_025051 [Tritrichomonas musculus]|uniref:SCP domain-containing protein n=1 Tax=Tritrichomonas musculus TaxID=1915356 RepID=A0ABR2HC97_9EUKA